VHVRDRVRFTLRGLAWLEVNGAAVAPPASWG
jgi:hypothetical protein